MLLNKLTDFNRRPGPVVLCIMDGIGYSDYDDGDAYKDAHTPNLDKLHSICQSQPLLAHGLSTAHERSESLNPQIVKTSLKTEHSL